MALIKRRRSADTTEESSQGVGEQQLELDVQPASYESAPIVPESIGEAIGDGQVNQLGEASELPEKATKVVVRSRRRSVTKKTEGTVENNSEQVSGDSAPSVSAEGGIAEQAQGEETPSVESVGSQQEGERRYEPRRTWERNGNTRYNNYTNNNGGYNSYGARRYNNRQNYRESREAREARNAQRDAEVQAAQIIENPEEYEAKPRLKINDLTKMSMPELRNLAIQYGISEEELPSMKKQDLIFVILRAHTDHGGIIFAEGALEILPDGYGFLRSPQNSYLPGPDDIYISPSQIRLFNIKTGCKNTLFKLCR